MIRRLIEKLLDKLLKLQSFQDYVNFRYNRKGYFPVSIKGLYYKYDTLFTINEQLVSIDEVINDYEFSDFKETDIVLDIGANIGAFTIFASKKAKHVYAVEPLFDDLIKKNIALNSIKNISVLKTALGSGHLDIAYEGRQIGISGKSLKELIDMCGGHIDFLKCDCEGGEWTIKAEELKGIRRIEMEYHISQREQRIKALLKVLDKAGFEYSIDNKRKHSGNIIATGLIHATSKFP